jgi:hypothetical protein
MTIGSALPRAGALAAIIQVLASYDLNKYTFTRKVIS